MSAISIHYLKGFLWGICTNFVRSSNFFPLFRGVHYSVFPLIRGFTVWLFSGISTECGNLRCKSLYLVRIQGNKDQKNFMFGLFSDSDTSKVYFQTVYTSSRKLHSLSHVSCFIITDESRSLDAFFSSQLSAPFEDLLVKVNLHTFFINNAFFQFSLSAA